MALTSQQRGWCVLKFHKTNSVVTVQHAFKRKFNVDPPTNKSILKWHGNFIERGCICDQRKGPTVGLGASCCSHQRILFAQPQEVNEQIQPRVKGNKRGAH